MTSKPKSVDVLIDVPYLWLNDGYGQTSPLVISLLADMCEDNNLSWGVLRATRITGRENNNPITQRITQHFINPRELGKVNLLFRYHYPSSDRKGAGKLVSYTMFETDQCPSGWVDILNQADLVLVPNPYLESIFSKSLSPPVETLFLPLHQEYYQELDDETLVGRLDKDCFRFSFVGTSSSTDRKGIAELAKHFDRAFRRESVALRLHSRGFKSKYSKVANSSLNIKVQDMLDFYLGAHAGVYPSRGEGYGLPQLETALLGRPVILALNSAAIWSSTIMSWAYTVSCEVKDSKYTHPSIKVAGNWGYCNMDEVIQIMKSLYQEWEQDKEAYLQKIIEAHNDNLLRDTLSHQAIKEQMESHLLPLLS